MFWFANIKILSPSIGVELSGVDLNGTDLSKAKLSDTDFTTSNLKNITLDNAIVCRATMFWGELNDGC